MVLFFFNEQHFHCCAKITSVLKDAKCIKVQWGCTNEWISARHYCPKFKHSVLEMHEI